MINGLQSEKYRATNNTEENKSKYMRECHTIASDIFANQKRPYDACQVIP
jgi:hypothetical protein